MLYPLPPPPFSARQVRIRPRNVVGISESPLTLQQQSYQWPGQRWEIEADFPPMPRDKAEMLVGWLTALNGRRGTFCFGDISANLGQGLFSKFSAPMSANGAQAAFSNKLFLSMGPGMSLQTYQKAIAAGDYLQAGGLNVLESCHVVTGADSGAITQNNQTDPYGVANRAATITTYTLNSRIMYDMPDGPQLIGGMLSWWVFASAASKWSLLIQSTYDSIIANSGPMSVPANTWTRIMLPLTYDAIQDYFAAQNQFSIVNGFGCAVTPTTAAKIGSVGTWDSGAYSSNSYLNGALCSFKSNALAGADCMAGLSQAPFHLGSKSSTYAGLRFAWYPYGDGLARIYENGTQIGTTYGAFTTASVFSISYDGSQVVYAIDGVTKYTNPNPGPGLRLWFGFAANYNAGVSSIAFSNPNLLTADIRGLAFNRMSLIGDTSCATVYVGGACYDPTGGQQFNPTDPSTAPQPQGYAHLYKAIARSDHISYGMAHIPVWPNLRVGYANGQNVRSSHAKGVFRLASEHDWTIDRAHIYGVTLKAVEAL